MLEDEKKLIKKMKSGDSSAFGVLYDYYHPMIYRFVLVRVSQSEEAEDLSHQVFLKAWQNAPSYEEKGLPFSSWLYQIARNQIIDHYRKSRIFEDIEDHKNHEFLIEKPDFAEKIDLDSQLANTADAIKQLKSIEQEVVLMRFVEELSIREVADALDKTEGAIKLIQFRAMSKLKEILKEDE